MQPLDNERWRRMLSRVLIAGEPYSRKTTSLTTWPRPCLVVVAPGEKGSAAIRHDPDAGLMVYAPDDGDKRPSGQIYKEIKELVAHVRAGGIPVESLAIDGVHKLYEVMLDAATNGDYFSGTEFEPRIYGQVSREFTDFLNTVIMSKIPNVVFTVWVAQEKDKPDPMSRTTHIWPDLPGRMAKRILGEFTAVVYAKLKNTMPGKPPAAVWQLKPDNEVWGIGIKCPADVAAKMPSEIPQDYKELMKILQAE